MYSHVSNKKTYKIALVKPLHSCQSGSLFPRLQRITGAEPGRGWKLQNASTIRHSPRTASPRRTPPVCQNHLPVDGVDGVDGVCAEFSFFCHHLPDFAGTKLWQREASLGSCPVHRCACRSWSTPSGPHCSQSPDHRGTW